MGKDRFATSRSAKSYQNWFKGNSNWNPSKVTTYTKEQYEKVLAEENKQRALNNIKG